MKKAMKKMIMRKLLSCFVVFVILMSTFSVAVLATGSSNSTASNDSPLNYVNTSESYSLDPINESVEVPDPNLPVLNDTDISTAKTVSSLGYCSYVWIEITDKYCKGYEVYVDGVYQFTEGESGTPDGYCRFKVTPGYHTFKLTLNGKEVSKGWNCQCGTGYNWMSMNDMIPHWCEGGGGGGDCDNHPTVSFDKTKYYEGDTVHITVHNPISGQVVDYEIKDCEGNSKEFKALPYGTSSIYYTLPTVSSCCYWKICFYWNEGQPPLGTESYCTKCYSFYVCPHETPCKVWINVEDKYCKGYKVYVDGVYQFTEGESGTPDGYCRFWVTPGTHKFELRKNGCSVSKSWYCQCGTYYSWTSMNDMYPRWCECNKPTPPPVKEVKFRGTVIDIPSEGFSGGYWWNVKVDKWISGSLPCNTVHAYYVLYADAILGHYDRVQKGDEVEVYGSVDPNEKCYINLDGESYYIKKISSESLSISVWTDKSEYKIGETVTINYQTNKKCTAKLTITKPDGGDIVYGPNEIPASTRSKSATAGYPPGKRTVLFEAWAGAEYKKATCYFEVVEENKPDLIVSSINFNPNPANKDDDVIVSITVKNQGNGDAGPHYEFLGYPDRFTLLKEWYCSGLKVGASRTFTHTLENVQQSDTYEACADWGQVVQESNENNNCLTANLEVKKSEEKPDLVVQNITCSPSSPKQGDTITFTVKIKNRGDGNAGTSTVKYYIDGSYVDSDTVPSLSVGSTSTQTFTWTANKCGDVQVKGIADATNAVDEGSNEGNNARTETIYVKCPPKKPDLTVYTYWIKSTQPKLGDKIPIYLEVKNVGTASAKSSIAKYYVGTSKGIIPGTDSVYPYSNYVYIGTVNIPALANGEVAKSTFNWIANKCGYVRIRVDLDADNEVDESNEANNQESDDIYIICPIKEKPDLIIKDISWSPENPKQGDNVKFAVTIKNIGKETAGKSHVFIYAVNWDAGELLFKIKDTCPSLKPGEIYTYHKNVKIENCGESNLMAWADAQNEVNESNKENNYNGASFTVPCPKEKGTLVVNVYSIDGKPATEVKGTTRVELVKSGDVSLTAKQNIDDKSKVTFNDIPAGNYYINVYHDPQLEQGSKEFWGQRKDISITDGTTTTIDFHRYNPYVDKFYAEKNSVEVNTPVKINVGIKVPSNCPDAEAYVKALVIIRDESGHEVYRDESDDRKVQKGGSTTFSLSYTPTKEGTYSGLTKAYIAGGGDLCTDNCGWEKVFTCQKEKPEYNPKISLPINEPYEVVGDTGTKFTIKLIVKNNGNIRDTINLALSKKFRYGEGTPRIPLSLSNYYVTLESGQSKPVYLYITEEETKEVEVTVTATSVGNSAPKSSCKVIVIPSCIMPADYIDYPLKYMLVFKNSDTKIHELTFSAPKYVKLSDKSITLKEGELEILIVIFDPKTSEENIKKFTVSVTDSISKNTETIPIEINLDYKIIATDFDLSKNGYNFKNWGVTIPVLNWNILGHCYDMAETSTLFFLKEKPLPLGIDCAYDIPEDSAKKAIADYGDNHLADNIASSTILILDAEDQGKEYDNLKHNIQYGNPTVIGMKTPGFPWTLHAVVAYKIIETKYVAYIVLYDNNYPFSKDFVDNGFRCASYNKKPEEFIYRDFTGYKNGKPQYDVYTKFCCYDLKP